MTYKHGEARKGRETRLNIIWQGMRCRCNTISSGNYHRYGGRGISICEEWDEYEVFRDWALASGYAHDLSIDRIDNDGNYCPENCRWATNRQQSVNRSDSRLLTMGGRIKSLTEWSEETGIGQSTIFMRLKRGWPVERALRSGR